MQYLYGINYPLQKGAIKNEVWGIRQQEIGNWGMSSLFDKKNLFVPKYKEYLLKTEF